MPEASEPGGDVTTDETSGTTPDPAAPDSAGASAPTHEEEAAGEDEGEDVDAWVFEPPDEELPTLVVDDEGPAPPPVVVVVIDATRRALARAAAAAGAARLAMPTVPLWKRANKTAKAEEAAARKAAKEAMALAAAEAASAEAGGAPAKNAPADAAKAEWWHALGALRAAVSLLRARWQAAAKGLVADSGTGFDDRFG